VKSIAKLIQDTHAAFVASLDELGCLPERHYVAVGDIAIDCDQFVTSATAVGPGVDQQGLGGAKGPSLWTVQLDLSLSRIVANLDEHSMFPEPEEVEAGALVAADDANNLLRAFYAAFGDQGTVVGLCDVVYLGGVTWSGPEGDYLTTTLQCFVQL
jgi:hypothetical protein